MGCVTCGCPTPRRECKQCTIERRAEERAASEDSAIASVEADPEADPDAEPDDGGGDCTEATGGGGSA